jgi:hypothetical protein
VNTHPLFVISIPSSRGTVPTGYIYVLPGQNGWSRYLHFEAAWLQCLPAWSLRLRVPRQLGYKSLKYLTHITVTDDIKKFGSGKGSVDPDYGYAWYAGI